MYYYYVLKFKYASKWHFVCYIRATRYDKEVEADQIWFVETARSSVERLRLQTAGCNHIQEAELHEMILQESADGQSAEVRFVVPPADAKQNIRLINRQP